MVGKYGTGWVTSCGAMAHKPACVSYTEHRRAAAGRRGIARETKAD